MVQEQVMNMSKEPDVRKERWETPKLKCESEVPGASKGYFVTESPLTLGSGLLGNNG